MATASRDFLPLLLNLTQTSLGMLYSGKEILSGELGDGRSVLTLILFILLGILFAHLPQLSVMAVSRKANSCQNVFQANLDCPGTLLIVLPADRCSEAAIESIAQLVRVLNHKGSSSSDREDEDSPTKRCSSFRRAKRPRPYTGYYRDLHKGKVTKDSFLSE